jgi:indole-3-glycerol phosphate synthase
MLRAPATGTYLDRILANTAAEVHQRMSAMPVESLREINDAQPAPVSLKAALTASDYVAVIAEFKRASPSKGEIAPGVAAAEIADDYLRGGCAALSVLTDERFFQGTLADLRRVADLAHQATPKRPVLRKDFTISPYQLLEARATGADAILLIVAALEDDDLRDLHSQAAALGLDVLVEIHDETELERALAISAAIIGINNRDLRTFEVDLATTERLAPQVPDSIAVVGESGVHTHEDVLRLGAAGVDAVLVGESLMRRDDRAQAVRELLGA